MSTVYIYIIYIIHIVWKMYSNPFPAKKTSRITICTLWLSLNGFQRSIYTRPLQYNMCLMQSLIFEYYNVRFICKYQICVFHSYIYLAIFFFHRKFVVVQHDYRGNYHWFVFKSDQFRKYNLIEQACQRGAITVGEGGVFF